jgi:ubiquitin
MADLDRREQLMAAMESAEEGTLDPVEDVSLDIEPTDDIAQEQEEIEVASDEPEEVDEIEEEPEVEAIQRPTTWKKEYLPIWDKLTSGEQLTKEESVKLAQYSNQRESEYKKGVSTYKAEADRARELENAIAPFAQEFQAQGITPSAWINNLGRAHMILSKAPHDQKVQLFHRLAQDYGIQLNQEGQFGAPQQVDAYTQQLMNQLNQVNQEVSTIKGRFQQEETSRLNNEIERVRSDVEKFPHFDVVREEMAQLLELGKAQDLETAYAKAVRLNDDVWEMEKERLLKTASRQTSKAQQVAKAKAAAVSPKSVNPSGKVADTGDKKDRRSLIAEQLGDAMNRRV